MRIATITTPREPVPSDVYEGIDFEDFNRVVDEYRALTRENGFSAALSRYVGEPVVVRTRPSA
jgi:hypothetical protein